MPQRIVFPAKGQARVESFELPAMSPKKLRLRSLYSIMSTGTENIIFNALYEPGTHWANWLNPPFPWRPGYSLVGRVRRSGRR